MVEKAKKWGSITILSSVGGTIVAMAVSWLFTQVVDVKPLVKAVNSNTQIIREASDLNSEQHGEISLILYEQKERLSVTETRLNGLEVFCLQNHTDIKACQERHYDK